MQLYIKEDYDETFVHHLVNETTCNRCSIAFLLNNRLHRYLRNDKCRRTRPIVNQKLLEKLDTDIITKSAFHTVESDATATKDGGLGFKQWHYATAIAKLSPEAELTSVYLDSGCTITLVDRDFLQKQCPDITILYI